MESWVEAIRRGERRRIARAISLIESAREEDRSDKEALLEALYPHTGNAWLVGITGSPGAGKSSLVDQLVQHVRQAGWTVGILAVDPTSPFTGGALLGDRVRMTRHALDDGVFIRSMGSRGSLGGLARAAKEAARVLDAAGFDLVLVETVGVGQSEIDVMHTVDTVALVLTPGSGDAVQVFKAGIMEIADVFVVNKADLQGAQKLLREVEDLLHVIEGQSSWLPPVLTTVSKNGQGIGCLWQELCRHRDFLKQSGEWEAQRQYRLLQEVREMLESRLRMRLLERMAAPDLQTDLEQVRERKMAPHQAVNKWLDTVFKGGGSV
ncbi:methylmalonyl Co-A mutase-associated GTPase MeaB [Marinithermofilum abyssi]|uniref:Methylmalonyl Co-A mutase-associated GTPase MeaB n=1 Tax=Marinithermofilum abyssi TaxID=1571185 RepID=A0A8J2YBN1_9BACL|nr:methylmalonyl Co-A mutase-associated GTPase MeaB [Marinithermofilum abyssi]GGE05563.1 methylmalonyl Co-A mutase-associated GTPase MeaB [Marinithermofilum abyssi]